MADHAINERTPILPSYLRVTIPWLAAVPAFVALLIGLSWEAALPGIYMDGVNPDYVAVALINPQAKPFPVTLLDGNYLFNRFPIMVQIYHGALPYWLGLPAFSFFGTGITGIRVAHALLAIIVLSAVWYFLRAMRTGLLITAVTALALAADPSFQYMFRNQFYITVFPVSLTLVSMALVADERRQTRLTMFVSGAAAGLAAYGYFIFYFFGFAIALFAPALRKFQLLRPWLAGAALGLLPVVLGYLLFIGFHGGPISALHAALDLTNSLGVMQSKLDIWDRVQLAFDLYSLTLSDQANTLMMLGTAVPFIGITFKVTLVIAIPLLIFIISELARRPNKTLRLCFAVLLMPLLYTMIFGNRLWAQHYAPTLPLFYCFAALAYDHLRITANERIPALPSAYISLPVGCTSLVLTALNIWNMTTVNFNLRATGGVGLMSDAINRFSEDARDDPHSIYIFPDWGLQMEFAMLTGGTSEIRVEFDPRAVRQALSSGHDVVLATIGNGAKDRRDKFATSASLPAPALSEVYQRDGVPVIFIAKWQMQ